MLAKPLAYTAARAVALDGVAHPTRRGDPETSRRVVPALEGKHRQVAAGGAARLALDEQELPPLQKPTVLLEPLRPKLPRPRWLGPRWLGRAPLGHG